MKVSNNEQWIKFLSTGFYSGYVPVLPGTVGSLVGVVVYLIIGRIALLHLLLLIVLVFIGPWLCARAEEIFHQKDSQKIVLDEIIGYLLSVYLLPFKWRYIISAFVLFRLFDMLKPGLIKSADELESSKGVVLDDILAGLFTNIILQIICHL